MRKFFRMGLLTLLFALMCADFSGAYAQVVVFDEQIAENVWIDAAVELPTAAYATYRIEYDDLTLSSVLNATALAERLFLDAKSEWTFSENLDPQHREGAAYIQNESGEFISANQTGRIVYMRQDRDLAYERAVNYMMKDHFERTQGERSANHGELNFLSREQAIELANSLADDMAQACGLSVELVDCMTISHAQLKAFSPLPPSLDDQTAEQYMAGWGEEKDGYVLLYRLNQDGLPICYEYQPGFIMTGQHKTTARSLEIIMRISREGIEYIHAQLGSLERLQAAEAIITPEEAVAHLKRHYDRLDVDEAVIIEAMCLQYLPVKISRSFSEGEMMPVWYCLIGNDGGFTPNVILMNAFTGDVLK